MTGILERVEEQQRYFTPESPDAFLALQLALTLQSPKHVRELATLTNRYPEPLILKAYQGARTVPDPKDRGEHFKQALARLLGKEEL